ncbi:MAG: hypothetical protein V2I48_06620 [Xanthomonadales bacterium]|jgi:hypothetical protein|nr:hypothetical protein [Xanthomonadales bacterium]
MMTGTQQDEMQARRKRAVKTAWLLAAVAITVFIAFLLSGILAA